MSENVGTKPCLFTIGHSDHDAPTFVGLLKMHGIQLVADVRSQPYSRFNPQFNREVLAEVLQAAGIDYAFLGRELGARRVERESYRGRQARYELIVRLPAFQAGLEWLRQRVAAQRIALLCSEKDPITCHRTVLVCRQLRGDPIELRHILDGGALETTEAAEDRLLDLAGLPRADLFRTRAELVEEAYDMQADRIAFTEQEPVPSAEGMPA